MEKIPYALCGEPILPRKKSYGEICSEKLPEKVIKKINEISDKGILIGNKFTG